MQIDLGNTGGGSDLYFAWSQRPSNDGIIPPLCFYTNKAQGADKAVFDHSRGFVIDLTTLKTGWKQKITHTWEWNANVSQMAPKPADDWQKGFSVQVALGKGADGNPITALWQQAGAGAWDALTHLSPQIAHRTNDQLVPVVELSGTANGTYNGMTWTYPLLTITNWISRPSSLSAPAPQIATAPAPIAAPVAQPVAAPIPQPVAQPVAPVAPVAAPDDGDFF